MASEPALEPVIGLEIHVQLATRTKLFCADPAEFGAPPNSRVCPVCLGLPGALPVLNARAVELAVRVALGLGCTVHPRSAFSRKSYFYPDLPKGYQITQHERPLATGGTLDVPGGGGCVRIRGVHLEEDSGKSLHDRVPGASAMDLNRAGVPLVEIVTEPDLRSPAGARAFLTRLKQAIEYLGASDCSMEEGSLRVDANVSLRRPGEAPGTRTEIKNLNSFGNLERALRFEIGRQSEVLSRSGRVEPLTLLWDAGHGEARPLRSKEEAHDYRYFPEPDLPPLEVPAGWLERIAAELPEMPWTRAARLERELGLPRDRAEVLSAERGVADYYEAVVAEGTDPREAANWLQGEVLALLRARSCSIEALRVRPGELAALLRALAEGVVSRSVARGALRRMEETGESAARVLEREAEHGVAGAEEVSAWAAEVVGAHPEEARRYRAGDERLLGYFVGQVIRRAHGRADPGQVAEALRRRLGS